MAKFSVMSLGLLLLRLHMDTYHIDLIVLLYMPKVKWSSYEENMCKV